MPFPFEHLTVYQKSLNWNQYVQKILKVHKLQLTSSFADQLSRAALSISANIAEGNGRWHKAEKRNFFWTSRGSVFECVSIMQVLRSIAVVTEDEYQVSYEALEELGKMLTRLIQSVEKLEAKLDCFCRFSRAETIPSPKARDLIVVSRDSQA